MLRELLNQHPDWVATFLTAVVVPMALGVFMLSVYWLDDHRYARQNSH
jgi:multisubunit Na+/H+ antiporter MnhC subunit